MMSLLTMLLEVWKKMLYLLAFGTKYGGKFGTNMEVEGEQWGRHPWEEHTYQGDVCAPLMGTLGPIEMERRCERGYHCKWGASVSLSTSSQICGSWSLPRFLFRRQSLTLDKYDLLYGPGDALGLPIHDGETVQLDAMTCGVDMVKIGEGSLT